MSHTYWSIQSFFLRSLYLLLYSGSKQFQFMQNLMPPSVSVKKKRRKKERKKKNPRWIFNAVLCFSPPGKIWLEFEEEKKNRLNYLIKTQSYCSGTFGSVLQRHRYYKCLYQKQQAGLFSIFWCHCQFCSLKNSVCVCLLVFYAYFYIWLTGWKILLTVHTSIHYFWPINFALHIRKHWKGKRSLMKVLSAYYP